MLGAYNLEGLLGVLMVIAVVDLMFRGWALWRAARLEQRSWFIALLVINSMAILPIIFLLVTNDKYSKIAAVKRK